MLTVLMATRNGAATLPKVLEAYCALLAPAQGWELLIADNGSSDGTSDVIERYSARLPLRSLYVERPGKNVALNAALALALGNPAASLFVFTDDDAAPAPDTLRLFASAAQARPECTMFGGAIVADWGAAPADWVRRLVPLGLTFGITAPELADGPIFPGLIWGANMALRRSVFEAGHRFDESIGPNGVAYAMGSETQLLRLLGEAGHQAWFCAAAKVAHYIRPHQVQATSILERAWRFGRGMFRQHKPTPCPYVFGVPRWMLMRYALELLGLVRTAFSGDRDQRFLHRWELAYLRGFFHEAWRVPRRAAGRVMITSYSGALGGMEMRMAQEARFLNAAGYHAVLALRPFPGAAAWRAGLREEALDVVSFNPPPFIEQWRWHRLNLWRAALWGARALRRHRVQLVHVAFCWTSYGTSALWLAQRCRLPAVISVHNAFPPEAVGEWHRPLLMEAFAAVRGVYAVSESALQHFLAIYAAYLPPTARLAVIPNCVDLQRFQPSARRRLAARQAWGVAPDALVIGCVGRLAQQKRPHAALAMLAELSGEFPRLHLVLIGSGPLEQALRAQAKALGIEARVIFAGFQADVAQWLPGFDLHALLSQNEGFGIATIEAMACAVATVGTDVPGTADVLRGSAGGVLVPLAEAAAAADAVAALLRDPARRARMGLAGRAEAELRYGVDSVRAQVQDFYRGLL